MTNYSVKVLNNSNDAWKFFIFQQQPDISEDYLTLAWFASPFRIEVGDRYTFHWTIDYQFVWSASGVIKPGVQFDAGGLKACDPKVNNSSHFDFKDETPLLDVAETGYVPGHLFLKCGPGVPARKFSVGVGMSGNGTFAVNAEPNSLVKFTATPTYFLAAVQDVKEGEVMDITTVTKSVQITYLPNYYDLQCTLQKDNTWAVEY